MFLSIYRVAESWEEALFRDRPNRFTLILRSGHKTVRAYLPNTGRLEEYLVEGSPFFIVPYKSDNFRYRVVSTFYQDNYVLLDTIRMNHLVGTLMDGHFLPGMNDCISVTREKSVGNSRFDFLVQRSKLPPLIIEVKTCTLAHNGVAMFPDAPTRRALSHVEHMSELTQRGFEAAMFFIIPNAAARRFTPNLHTDPVFSQRMIDEQMVTFRALTLRLIDPVGVELQSLNEIPIDLDYTRRNIGDRGSYMLVLENSRDRKLEVASLGARHFRRGYYVYVGSGLRSLSARVSRHSRTRKKKHWHIDYITPEHFKLRKTYIIRRTDRPASCFAGRLRSIAQAEVAGFGASDSNAPSHLFHFNTPPFRSGPFIDVLLDFRTGTE